MQGKIVQTLRSKPFLFLFLAEIFSQVGMNMLNFILIILAFNITKSSTAVAGVVVAFTAPAIIFGLIAGAMVDRWNKKQVLLWTNLVRAAILIILIFAHTNLWYIYILAAVFFTVTQFFIPAETPMIPLLVKKELLLPANALFGTGIFGSILIAYALSTPTLAIFGSSNVFIVLSLLFVIAAVFVLSIPYVGGEKEGKTLSDLSFTQEIQTALTLMVKTKKIYHALILLAFSQLLILILAVIGPGYATHVLGIRVEDFPLFFVTPAALGMAVGAVVLGNFFNNVSKEKCATIGVFISGIGMLLLPYALTISQTLGDYFSVFGHFTILNIMVVLAFALGLANALVFVPSNTILQEETSDEVRGKLYGGLNAFVGVLSILPVILVGTLSDTFGVGNVLIGVGMAILLVGVLRLVLREK